MESTAISELATVLSRLEEVGYVHLAMLALMVYDWLIFFDREVEHLWQSDWNITKILFIVSRYGPFIDMPMMVITHMAPYGKIDPGTCNILYRVSIWNTFLGMASSECILLLRTYAIYSGSRRVIFPLSITYAGATVTGIFVTWSSLRKPTFGPPPNALFKGCYLVRRGGSMFFTISMLLALELAVVILTLRKGFYDSHPGTPLLRVLYRDSIAFFLVLFSLTLTTILVLALAPHQYRSLTMAPTRVIHSIVCGRILLNLRRAAKQRCSPRLISADIVFATAPVHQTNQAETIQLELYRTRGDEEDLRRQANGTGRETDVIRSERPSLESGSEA